jgi:hypothetical protein
MPTDHASKLFTGRLAAALSVPRMSLPRVGAIALLIAAALATVVAGASSRNDDRRGPGVDPESPRFTLAVVPDMQYLYGDDYGDSQPLDDAFRWILSNRASENIVFASSLGDVTQDGTEPELARAHSSYRILDRERMPYSVVAGNHDVRSSTDDQRGDTPYLQVFGPQRFEGSPTFAGASPGGYNQAHRFRAAGRDWLVLALDWRISDTGLAWARSVLDAHRRTPTILTTHELVTADGGEAVLSGYGQRLWDELIRSNDQIFLTLNGHFWPTGRKVMQNDFGHDVQLNLANYQDQHYGGAGMIRTYAFDLARRTIDVSTFSPYVLDQEPEDRDPLEQQMTERTGTQDRFSLPLDFEERFGGPPAPGPVDTEDLVVPGTVALWRPQSSTALPDLSGSGNDLMRVTLPGSREDALTISDDHAPLQPTHGSLRFQGGKNPARGAYLRTADGAPLNRMEFRSGYTIEAFLKAPAGCCPDNAWMGLVGQMGTGADAGKTGSDPLEGILGLNLGPAAELQFAVWPTNRIGIATNWSHLLEGETWTHVAVVNDGRFTTMYVDGSLVVANPLTPAIGLTSTGRFWMLGGNNYDNVIEQTFNGWLGDVRIVDRPLAVDEFMPSVREPRFEPRARRAELDGDEVEVRLENTGRRSASGEATARVRVPTTGLRIELGDEDYRVAPGRAATLDFRLSHDEERALRAVVDGARVEVRLEGGGRRAHALLHLGP